LEGKLGAVTAEAENTEFLQQSLLGAQAESRSLAESLKLSREEEEKGKKAMDDLEKLKGVNNKA